MILLTGKDRAFGDKNTFCKCTLSVVSSNRYLRLITLSVYTQRLSFPTPPYISSSSSVLSLTIGRCLIKQKWKLEKSYWPELKMRNYKKSNWPEPKTRKEKTEKLIDRSSKWENIRNLIGRSSKWENIRNLIGRSSKRRLSSPPPFRTLPSPSFSVHSFLYIITITSILTLPVELEELPRTLMKWQPSKLFCSKQS